MSFSRLFNGMPGSKSGSRLFAFTVSAFAAVLAGQHVFAQAAQADAVPASAEERVNINEADADTLADVLQGVGQSRARAIVEYREQNGRFDSLDELADVNGVGEATVNLNRERIVLE
ncbi:MAG: ComEA family DNA-binding protein [Pseudohongiellaceae bacterium]|jgi:competence protein ComEA